MWHCHKQPHLQTKDMFNGFLFRAGKSQLVQGSCILFQLPYTAGANEHAGHFRPAQNPRQSHLGQRLATGRCDVL